MATPSARRRDQAKEDWLCKTCTGRDGKAYRNFGTRSTCRLCHLAKGACFWRKVDAQPPRALSSLAERQVRAQRADAAHAKATTKKNAELASLKAELRKREQEWEAKSVQRLDEEMGVDVVEGSPTFEYTVDQLMEQRRLLKNQGKSDDHPDVASLSLRIEAQQQAKLAEKPGHVRVARADRKVKQCRAAVEASETESAKLQEELGQLQQRIVDNAARLAQAQQALGDAERQRDELHRSLQSAAGGSAAGCCDQPVTSWDGLVAFSAQIPEEAFVDIGCAKQELGALLHNMQVMAAR